jgi:hypothetical protein
MLLSGATNFERRDGFVEFFAAMQGLASDQIDQLWRDAASLN